MSTKHTPGPWYACGDEVLIDMGDRAHLVATAADWSEETEPNACLIAAAPDLLEALRIAVRQNSADMLMTGEELRQCEAAIARATGAQP
jgi:hypothetical protein